MIRLIDNDNSRMVVRVMKPIARQFGEYFDAGRQRHSTLQEGDKMGKLYNTMDRRFTVRAVTNANGTSLVDHYCLNTAGRHGTHHKGLGR